MRLHCQRHAQGEGGGGAVLKLPLALSRDALYVRYYSVTSLDNLNR